MATSSKDQQNGSFYPGYVINLSHVTNVSSVARYICLSAEMYAKSLNFEVVKEQKEIKTTVTDRFRLLSMDELRQIASTHIAVDRVTLTDLFTPSMRTMVYGDSNVGKSFFMQQISLAISTGTSAFHFTMSAPSRVAYLDGEMGDTFISRLDMLNGGNHCPPMRNLKSMPLRGESLADTKKQQEILMVLREYEPNVVIIDNICALFNEAVRGNVDSLINFVCSLELLGIAVVLVHHTEKTGNTYKGPSEFAALCQNVIHLLGRDQIVAKFEKERTSVPPQIQALINSETVGPVISISFKKCKLCPELEKRESYFYLPVNGQWKHIDLDGFTPSLEETIHSVAGHHGYDVRSIGTVSTSSEAGVFKGNESPNNDHADDSPQDLSEKERKILEFGKHSKVENKSIREMLGCSRSTAASLLSGLVAKNLLISVGRGPATHYILVGKHTRSGEDKS